MALAKKKPDAAPPTPQALAVYVDTLVPYKSTAEESAEEAQAALTQVLGFKIDSKETFAEVAEVGQWAHERFKFFDAERTISVGPLNEEVDRINAWFKPGLDMLKRIKEVSKTLMGAYMLEQRRREDELLRAAQEAAQKALATDADVQNSAAMQESRALVSAAADVVPVKVAGVSDKTLWKWTLLDPAAFVRAHPEMSMPDEKKLAAWVSQHGDKNVPVGVKVEADVKISLRSVKK